MTHQQPFTSSGRYQRSTYKLLDKILSTTSRTPIALLSALVDEIVDSDRLVMTGGRVWELDPNEDAYILRRQVGEVEFLDAGTEKHVSEVPAMLQLAAQRSLVTVNTNNDNRGHRVLSLTGIGDVVQRPSGKLYPYALAFTARELTDEFRDAILVIGSAATTALRNMLSAQREIKMQRDLDQAWEIQRGLVPDHSTSFNEFDVYGLSVPDSVVGGDYFDYLRPSDDDDRLSIVVSDAASKGLPAAIQALFVSGALRMGVSYNTKIASLIARLNTLIYDTFPLERFVSLFYCELTASSNGLILYANAGHCPPVVCRAASASTELLQPTGGILGIVSEQTFGVENINMQPGDVLVLYTDGITEAQDRNGELYGEERLCSVIQGNVHATPHQIAVAILESVVHHAVGATYSDDRTIVVVKRRQLG